jgi:hypothetical protein
MEPFEATGSSLARSWGVAQLPVAHAARNHPGENGEASTTSGFLYGSCSSRPEVALRRDPRRHCPCGSSAAAAASASSPLTAAKSRRRPTRSPAAPLVKALARAWRWQRQLDDGVYTSVSEIGDAENISKSYISRILRLALLAPDIIEAILAGRTERVIMLESLERPLPGSWEEQRVRLLEPRPR